MEGGHPLAFQSHFISLIAPQGDPQNPPLPQSIPLRAYLGTRPCKGPLVQYYMSLQDLNSCTGSSSSFNLALVHCPTDLLVSGALGRLLYAWERRLSLDRCTCGFTCTLGECSLHGRTCWAARLCVHCALAVLATLQTALAISQHDRLPRFISIVQTLDDVTRKSPIAFIVPLTLDLGCHLHYPTALCPLVTSTSVL